MKQLKPLALEANAVSAQLGQRTVLENIHLQIPQGRWISIVGPNGAGKSTLLRVLAGLEKPSAGSVQLLGQPLESIPARQRARQMVWLGQNEGVLESFTVLDTALLGRLPHQHWLAAAGTEDFAATEQALRCMGAWDWRDKAMAALSGGERQRVLLARALATDSDVLLLDEPIASLDAPHQADWLLLVRQKVLEGKTVVSVLHDLLYALQADDMVVMAGGRVQHCGMCSEAATHRALEAVFDQRIAVRQLGDFWVTLPMWQPKTH